MLRLARRSLPFAATVAAVCLAGALAAFLVYPARAQSPPTCPDPAPTTIAVDAVPIVVESTTADYFVLYVSHDVDGTELELPVLVKRGSAGTTTLAENVEALPAERYTVEKYLIADPADVDGDCIDDITELDDLGNMSPVNPAVAIDINDGALAVPDNQTYDALAKAESFKFILLGMNTDRPSVYFLNATTYPIHQQFLDDKGIGRQQALVGVVLYSRNLVAPNGTNGLYLYTLRGFSSRYSFSFSLVERANALLAASMPFINDNLAFYVRNDQLLDIQSDLPLYQASRINLIFDDPKITFRSLNEGVGYGLLRALSPGERPHSRDVVIYEALPNELPRVAGIITTVRQTPLSHVNLRAIQDAVPNAYVRGALGKAEIASLVDRYVRYEVTETGWDLRAATSAEVDAHYASSRPSQQQTPQRDLSVRSITPLNDIAFDDWDAFGVKAANVALLRTLGFPTGTVPDGFAIPFYFYDEFMKHNNFYTRIETMLADPDFQSDFDTQEDELKDLRDDIEDAETPAWIVAALAAMNEGFPDGIHRRYRSSTNNEDLPGFNGAGLYDSKSQKPDEDVEDGLDKSLKEVYASLWNYRAFIERDFHRVDHLEAAMGILVHPSYQDELVNGVAVTFDPVYGWEGYYYVNSQVEEDLVTNPDALSRPEELLLGPHGGRFGTQFFLATSNQVAPGTLLMSDAQLTQLRQHLTVIHDHFKGLYNPAADEPFAMEIEFKITSDNVLAIKQARPWVFGGVERDVTPPPPTPTPVVTTGGGGGFGPAPVAPRFVDGFRTTRAVAENARPGDAVGEPVAATHPDDLEITYSLSGADASLFAVDEETGQIMVREGVELALGTTYSVNLTATDSAGFGAIVIVMIEVTEASFSPYDLNGNDAIERDEVIMAIRDYFSGEITKGDVIELIKLYFAGPS